MRILQINNHEAVIGGSDRVYQKTCELLSRAGHEVVSLACGEAAGSPWKTPYVLPYNAYRGRSPLDAIGNAFRFLYRPDAARLVREIVERHRPDVAHLHIFYGHLTSSILGALAAARVPVVMSVHEYRMLCPVSNLFRDGRVCEDCAGGGYRHAIWNRCNRGRLIDSALSAVECWYRDTRYPYEDHVDEFLMVSEFCRQKHLRYRPALEHKASTLYNFVDAAQVGPAPAGDRPGYLLYAGRLSAEKGVGPFLDAIRDVDVEIVIAGTGALSEDLRARFARPPKITFVGHLAAPELARVIAGARYCLVPSVWYENNPMAVLESFANGVPVIGSRMGGIPELITEGVTGFLFDPSDPESVRRSVAQACSLPQASYDSMRQACVALVRGRHSPEVHLDALLQAYERAIARAGRRHV